MSTRCDELATILFTRGIDRAARIEAIDRLGDVRDCIVAGLREDIAAERWGRLERWFFAAFRQPSPEMAPILCDVLVRRLEEVHNEDLVDLLGEIADPASVPALEDALIWEPDWDEAHHLARKAVWALGAIGTAQARAVLEDAAAVGPDDVREFAQAELEALGDR